MEFIGPDIPWALEKSIGSSNEDEDRDNPATPSKKRQAEVELISSRSFARLKKVATFND